MIKVPKNFSNISITPEQRQKTIDCWSAPNPRDAFYKSVFGMTYAEKKQQEEVTKYDVSLPKCYKPLWEKTDDPLHKNAMYYLKKRGIGGKELLKNELGKKQANVTYLECYQRNFKTIDFDVIANYSQKETLYILITSSQIAQHFIHQLGLFENPDQIYFDNINFIVNHANIAKELSVFECDIKITPTLDPEKLQSLCID